MRLIARITLASVLGACSQARPQPADDGAFARQLDAMHRMTSCVNAGDASGYAGVYADDAVIAIAGAGELRGRRAIEEHEVELLREFPGARLSFCAMWQQGAQAAVHYAVDWHGGDRAMGHEGLLFFRFLPSGLVAEERRYVDSLTPMAQMGALGPVEVRPLPEPCASLQSFVASGSPEEEANVAAVKAALGALDSGDERAFLERLAEDAVVDDLTRPHPAAGREEVRAWFASWTRAFPDATSRVTSALGAGDGVAIELVAKGTHNGTAGLVPASDRPFEVHRALIARVRGGKIVRLSLFANGKELAEAVGRWPLPR